MKQGSKICRKEIRKIQNKSAEKYKIKKKYLCRCKINTKCYRCYACFICREIRRNGFEFIPVEVTPGFYSEDDNSTIGNGAVSGSDNQDSESEDSSSDQDNNDNDDSTEINLL